MDNDAFWFACLAFPVMVYGIVRMRYVLLNPAAANPKLPIIALVWILIAAAVVCAIYPDG